MELMQEKADGQKAGSMDWLRAHKLPVVGFVAFLLMLLHGVYLYARYDTKYAIALSVVFGLIISGVTLLCSERIKRVRHGEDLPFMVGFIAIGMMFSLVFAPGTVPDESYHFNSTYKYSDMLTGQPVSDTSIAMRKDDIVFVNEVMGNILRRSNYREVVLHTALFAGDEGYEQFEVPSTYDITANVPQLRIPSALGIVLAKLLGLGSVWLFYFGRVFNLLYCATLVFMAIRITPVGKNIFKIVSLLPMTLHLAASYSYDAGAFGLALLYTAYLLHLICGEGRVSRKELIVLAILSAVLAPAKTVYVVLVFAVVLIPGKRFGSRSLARLCKFGVIGCCFAGIALLKLGTLVSMAGVSESVAKGLDYRGTESGHFYTMSGLLQTPLKALMLFLRTLQQNTSYYMETMVGGSLGWFQQDFVAQPYICVFFYVVLLVAFCKSTDDPVALSPVVRAVFVVIFIIVFMGVVLALATSHTFDSELVIMGVQGRYFLPVLPMLGLGIRGEAIAFAKPMGNRLVAAVSFVDLFYLLTIFAIVMTL